MTRQDKIDYLHAYCKSDDRSCYDCPFNGIDDYWCNHYNEYTAPDEVIDASYIKLKNALCINDMVNHPSHYTQGGIECIDAMLAAFGAKELQIYCKIAAFKYLWRSEHKNGNEDIEKAKWYLNKYTELMHDTDNN